MNALLLGLLIAAPLVRMLVRFATTRRIAHLYAAMFYGGFFSTITQQRFGFSITVALAGVIVVTEVLRLLTGGGVIRRWRLVDGLVLALLAWAGVSAVARPENGTLLPQIGGVLGILLFSKLRNELTPDDQAIIRRALVLAGLIVAFCAFVQTRSSTTLYGLIELRRDYAEGDAGRVTGTFANPNLAGLYLLLAYATAITRPMRRDLRSRALWLAPAAVIFYGVFLTESRAAMVGAAAITALIAARSIHISRRAAVVMILTGAAVFVLVDPVSEAFRTVFLPDRPSLADTGRESRWELARDTIAQNPIFGNSLVEYRNELANFHNDVIEYTVNLGIPGGVLFVALLVELLRQAWKRMGREGRGSYGEFAFCALIGVLMVSASHTVIQSGIVFWLLMGWTVNRVGEVRPTAAASPSDPPPSAPPALVSA